jgi:DNA/RNA-binding domain of Phe-tRNA-synthetase-like protein
MIRRPHRQGFHRTHGHVNTETRRMLLILVALASVGWQ